MKAVVQSSKSVALCLCHAEGHASLPLAVHLLRFCLHLTSLADFSPEVDGPSMLWGSPRCS